MTNGIWKDCLERLKKELSHQDFSRWIDPIQSRESDGTLFLFAPNIIVADWLQENCLSRIQSIVMELNQGVGPDVQLLIGKAEPDSLRDQGGSTKYRDEVIGSPLNVDYVFENFVEGKCNQVARAAALQVADHPGTAYNPLLIYGGVGLGKTHLMQAVGHHMNGIRNRRQVAYVHSERFVGDMVSALRHNTMNEFKTRYRSLDVLLIDDIQFFAGKDRSQEEFFHTLNNLIDGHHQVIVSCDRYPKEVEGLEERLKSRFSWGLTVAIEPPELETSVAIITRKAERLKVDLLPEVSFFIAQRIRTNIRELEGALHRVVAYARFTGQPISLPLAKEALKDLIALQQRLVSLENIQRTVAAYYRIRVSDLISKSRKRSIVRPRQIAMTLAKELTEHSLPEIGSAFGGRDHTTVLHAHQKVRELTRADSKLRDDYDNLLRTLTG
ncbi:chromosomal replication initiator protein DnaA [mine drainage metagenome]|uniref:Chromosomal replication initiator protein DnaA n=3 Tax=mine drainage metagenome TaxID=410659 RepID=T1D2N3_9ZZZZ